MSRTAKNIIKAFKIIEDARWLEALYTTGIVDIGQLSNEMVKALKYLVAKGYVERWRDCWYFGLGSKKNWYRAIKPAPDKLSTEPSALSEDGVGGINKNKRGNRVL